MKKAVALILAGLMLAMSVCACSSEPGQEGTTTTANPVAVTTAPTEVETTEPVDEGPPDPLPADLRFDGETVRFLARDRAMMEDEVSVDEQNGEVINDAIFKRNMTIEERLGITIETFKTGGDDANAITNHVRTMVQSHSDEYDVFHNAMWVALGSIGDNIYHNLYDFEYLNLENPWWSQGFNEELSFGNGQYLASGDISLSMKRFTYVTFFNKTLFENYNIGNVYDVVRDGKWTIEYQGTIAAQMYRDLNGNQQRDQEDGFGFMAPGATINVDPYWSSCDLDILKKTVDNEYEFAIDVDRLTLAVETVNRLFWENEGSWSVPNGGNEKEQYDTAHYFAVGNAGMVTLRLSHTEVGEMREMTDPYGILPIPKLDESIDKYYSCSHDMFNGYGVPLTVPESRYDLVGATLEYMAYQSKRIVTPAYYEVAMKTKYASDPDTGEMLDLIFENYEIDAGVLYGYLSLGKIHEVFRTHIGKNNNNVASALQRQERLLERQLDMLQSKLRSIQD